MFAKTSGIRFRDKRYGLVAEYNYAKHLFVLLKPTTFDEQWDAFGKLLKELKSKSVNMVVVDGMTMLYRLELAEAENNKDKVKKINGILARQMRMLAEIARKKNIPII